MFLLFIVPQTKILFSSSGAWFSIIKLVFIKWAPLFFINYHIYIWLFIICLSAARVWFEQQNTIHISQYIKHTLLVMNKHFTSVLLQVDLMALGECASTVMTLMRYLVSSKESRHMVGKWIISETNPHLNGLQQYRISTMKRLCSCHLMTSFNEHIFALLSLYSSNLWLKHWLPKSLCTMCW